MVDSILVQIVLEINNNKGIHHNNGLVEKNGTEMYGNFFGIFLLFHG